MRAGFSRYYEKQAGVRFGHVICQVWDEQRQQWIMMDPDRSLVDMSKKEFDFAWMAWENVRTGKVDPEVYTSSVSNGIKGIVNLLILDASLLIRQEKLYWDTPEVVLMDWKTTDELDVEIRDELNRLAEYCRDPDVFLEEIRILLEENQSFHSAGIKYDAYLEMILENR
jgi:hypothetical protein